MAGKYAKWLGAGLGWALGGPIGGIFGFALGSMFEGTVNVAEVKGNPTNQYRRNSTPEDFTKALLVLSAAVMKADGKIMRSELDYVKDFFQRQFGPEKASDLILVLKEILKQDFELREVCAQIRFNMEHSSRLTLLQFLFGISQADGDLSQPELNLMEGIAHWLGISQADFVSLKAMYFKDRDAAYKILEILPTASDDEVKKAYRKMAVKYHPDKSAHLGADIQNAAKEKFQKLQDAYEEIKKERGLK